MPSIDSPGLMFMPFTPMVSRPIGRASASSHLIALPAEETMITFWPSLTRLHRDELVVIAQVDGDDAVSAAAVVGLDGGLLDHAVLGREHQELVGARTPWC